MIHRCIGTGRYQNIIKAVVISVGLLTLTGCLSSHGVASINSNPPGVQVFDMEDGTTIGLTPVKYHWRSTSTKRKYMNLRLHKDGYQDAVKSFWLDLGHKSADSAFKNPQYLNFELSPAAE